MPICYALNNSMRHATPSCSPFRVDGKARAAGRRRMGMLSIRSHRLLSRCRGLFHAAPVAGAHSEAMERVCNDGRQLQTDRSPGADVAWVSPSPGVDVAGVSPSPGADVAGVSPVPVQKWQG